jgi:hypothetical protein
VTRKATPKDPLRAEVVEYVFYAIFYKELRKLMKDPERLKGMQDLKAEMDAIRQWNLERLSPEERLKGLRPEERIAGLSPEQLLAGMTPEGIEQLRKILLKRDPLAQG